MKTIAVIGSGISGLAAAYLLSRRHRVDLFEQERRLGGHTNTVLVDGPKGTAALDTGFLVHNDRTDPNLVRLFAELGVATRDSDMSFAVSCRQSGLEYSSCDHLGDPSRPLRDRLGVDATRHGIELPDGPVFLLTHLRYLGYGFNPVSFFYCFDRAERLQVVLAEVRNTFGGAHNYWLRPDSASPTFRAAATKSLYVSPFMPVDLEYAFAFTPPVGRLVAHMNTVKAGSVCFDATLSLERRPWSSAEIRRALVRHPAMTAIVMAGIHWQALRLWWKGVPVVRRLTRDGVGERAAYAAETAGRTDSVMER